MKNLNVGKMLIISLLVIISFIFVHLYIGQINNTMKDCEKLNVQLKNRVDSLNDEIFNLKTQIGRYELTIDHLKEVNPQVGVNMEKWLEHNTE
jgi:predicted PurR-regulated permease PerM